MTIKPIKSKKDYQNSLILIEKLWDSKLNTAEGDLLEIITILVEDYEKKYFKIDYPDPVEAIKFRMEQLGLRNSDVASIFGGKNRVSEILNRKRNLTVNMIKRLHTELGIPAESLLI